MTTHCRIGRVRLRGVPNVEVLRPVDRGALEIQRKLREHAAGIAAMFPVHGRKRMAGFAIVAWDMDGGFTRGTRFHRDSQIGHVGLPSFVAEVLRLDVMRDVTLETLGLDPNPPEAS